MALINNNYVLVTEESVDRSAETTSHPTEYGLPVSDTVRIDPITVSLAGKIVDTDKAKAGTIIKMLKHLQEKGSLITYVGQVGTIKSLQIQDFNTNYNNKNFGGADFDMTLKEIRMAKRAYVRTKAKTRVKVTRPNIDFKLNQLVMFTGGYVYKSSDAPKHSAKRGKTKCKVTKISTIKGAKHIYHLISQDSKYGSNNYVYGWVDASNIESISKSVSKTSNSGGTQQIHKLME